LKRNNYCLYNSRVYIMSCNYLIIMIIITLSKVTKHASVENNIFGFN